MYEARSIKVIPWRIKEKMQKNKTLKKSKNLKNLKKKNGALQISYTRFIKISLSYVNYSHPQESEGQKIQTYIYTAIFLLLQF